MSKHLEKAKELRAATAVHYNCAQAVIVSFAEDVGITEEAAMRVAANFGSGMKRASVCGAVTGGLMVLGLFGVDDAQTVGTYYSKLKERHEGCLDCADLLQLNKQSGQVRSVHCDNMVYECVELVEEILKNRI